MEDTGCVTGRLQPIHLDHLDLMRIVLERHHRLIVAITNPDPSARTRDSRHEFRHLPADNPFTYYERQTFVRSALMNDGVSSDRFDIVPFPLHNGSLVAHYVPLRATQYVRTYSAWEDGKAEMLRSYGYPVVVIHGNGAVRRSGKDIRAALGSGEEWRHSLPDSVAALVRAALRSQPMSQRVVQ